MFLDKYAIIWSMEGIMKRDIDLFLFIPCDLTNLDESKLEKNISQDGTFLVSMIEKFNNSDLKNSYIKSLKRKEIGNFKLNFNGLIEEGIIYFTIHPRTNLGIITFYLSKINNKPNTAIATKPTSVKLVTMLDIDM